MLTKDLVGKLSPEQQELLAQMEFRKTQQRLKLLELARGKDRQSRYFPIYIFAAYFLFTVVYYSDYLYVQAQPANLFLPVGVMVVFSVFGYIARTNRRLDAMIELIDLDRVEQANRKQSV